ncbi:MAG: DUF5010 domain-containing protein [Planctomycetota bacterium]|nr:DUF5010 domain-containing protein [Planctomycetota bacterium]
MNQALTVCVLAVLGSPPEDSGRPTPPGPHVRALSPEALQRTTFHSSQPLVGTYYFYWYDDESGAHFVDPDGSDALTRHPAVREGYSYKRAAWHRQELLDIRAAGIDFVLPIYWGYPGDYGGWSFVGLPPLVEAARKLAGEGKHPPRIGCFYDTSTLRHNRRRFHADLRTREGKEWLYTTVRDFFSLIPPDLRAAIDGRPIVWLYSAAFARAQDPQALDTLRREFRTDFGVEPFVVKEISWQGRAAATYAWGAALKPSVHGIAAIGPGYDHAAVPGRAPLVKDRENGAFYRRSWEWVLSRPLARRPRIAVVETWNEWHEGTDIAPSRESGRKYVELTRKYADLWHAEKQLVPRGPFAARRQVSVVLGSPDRADGISRSEEPDGKTRAVDVDGRSARETVKTRHGGRYIYFDVADSFFWAQATPLVVEVTFLDDGKGSVGLDYDSTDPSALLSGAFKPAAEIRKEGTGRWKTVTLRLEDAAFTGRANGNDFRLVDRDGSLKVHRVVVRLATPRKASPPPGK